MSLKKYLPSEWRAWNDTLSLMFQLAWIAVRVCMLADHSHSSTNEESRFLTNENGNLLLREIEI